MSFTEIFNSLLESSGSSIYALSKKLGISDTAVYRWRDGVASPTLDLASKVADFFGVTLDELAGRESPPPTEQAEQIAMVELPLLGEISAGPFEPEEENRAGKRPIPLYKLGRANPKDCYILRVSGRSMDQVFHDGEYIVVKKTSACNSGDVVVAYDENLDGFTLKTFIRQGNIVVLQPANPEYAPIIYDKPNKQKLEIIGVVLCSERDF
nr:MAG TPA: Repressor protein CI [Bacteriophage sp.]